MKCIIITLDTYALLTTFACVMVSIILMIYVIRLGLRKRGKILSNQSNENAQNALLKKYPSMDILKNRSGLTFRFSMLISLIVSLTALSWTSYDTTDKTYEEGMFDGIEELEITPPPTGIPLPPPPPPAPPIIPEIIEVETIIQPEFIEKEIEKKIELETGGRKVRQQSKSTPFVLPKPKKEPEGIFRIVEQMPRFPGCEDISGSNDDKQKCATKKMLEFIYKNIKYPAIARENGVEGSVVIQFVVEKNGKVTEAKLVRDIGAGTGDEALRVVDLMNTQGLKWTPGKQRGRPVRVQFTLPVKFQLQ